MRSTTPERRTTTPSPGTPGEGWGGGLPWTRIDARQTPTLALPRSTGRGNQKPLAAVIALALFAGCATKPDPIPHYPLTDAPASLDLVRTHLAAIKTVRGEATINLTDAKGQSVSLDGAYVLAPPGRARLRAWKFGTAVFDLTIDGDKAWAYLPRDEAKPAAPGLRQSIGRWMSLIGGDDALFAGPAKEVGDELRLARPEKDGFLTCTVDRPTLTPRRYAFVDGRGVERFVLTFADYRPAAAGQVWPTTIVAKSESGTVEVRTGDVEINGDLPDALFKPPARAEALP